MNHLLKHLSGFYTHSVLVTTRSKVYEFSICGGSLPVIVRVIVLRDFVHDTCVPQLLCRLKVAGRSPGWRSIRRYPSSLGDLLDTCGANFLQDSRTQRTQRARNKVLLLAHLRPGARRLDRIYRCGEACIMGEWTRKARHVDEKFESNRTLRRLFHSSFDF